jgi:hypothetical protein
MCFNLDKNEKRENEYFGAKCGLKGFRKEIEKSQGEDKNYKQDNKSVVFTFVIIINLFLNFCYLYLFEIL